MPAYIIYIFVEIPPKMSISSFVGYLKGKSTLMIFERFSHLKYNYGNRHFGVGDFMLILQEEIKRQLKSISEIKTVNMIADQISFKEYNDTFKGSK